MENPIAAEASCLGKNRNDTGQLQHELHAEIEKREGFPARANDSKLKFLS